MPAQIHARSTATYMRRSSLSGGFYDLLSPTCFRLAFARASIDESKKKQGVGLAKDQTEDVGPWPDQTRPVDPPPTSPHHDTSKGHAGMFMEADDGGVSIITAQLIVLTVTQ